MDPRTAPPSVAPMIDPGEGTAVTKVGQLLVSVDEFLEGDGLVLVVVCGLSVYVVEDAFMML